MKAFTRFGIPLALFLSVNACIGLIGDGDGDGASQKPSDSSEPTTAADAHPQVMRIAHAVYRNALVDVIGLDEEAALKLALPADNPLEGFTNHLDLQVAAPQVQAYALLAEQVGAMVGGDPALVERAQAHCDGSDSCLETLTWAYGARLFGRPLSPEEHKTLVDLVISLRPTVVEQSGLAADLRLLVTVLLQSPHFLFRLEPSEPAEGMGGPAPRTGYEIARALAAMLWMSVPDDALLDAAAAGELDHEAGVDEAIARMLADDKAERSIEDFVDHLLMTERYDEVSPTEYEVTPELRRTWVEQVRLFARTLVLEEEGNFAALLLADHSYINRHNAFIYERDSDSETFERVVLDERYAGLLTMSGWLALAAKPSETHPIVRGARVLDHFLCMSLQPVDLDADDLAAFVGETVRERVESGTGMPSCQACHGLLNPLGFAFEGFDEVGKPQTHDNGKPIDTTGTITVPGGKDYDPMTAEIDGARAVAELIASSPRGQHCFAERWVTHSLGYLPAHGDPALAEVASQTDAPIRSLMRAMARQVRSRNLTSEREVASSCP